MQATATAEAEVPECGKVNPQVLGGVARYLSVSNASEAAAFYTRAFGAEEVSRHPVDEQGRTMHIHLYLNGASVMLSDFYPEYGHPQKTPESFNLHLQVNDLDGWWDCAVAAGAEVDMPLQEMFWGDRYGQLRDPFGVLWGLGSSRPSNKN